MAVIRYFYPAKKTIDEYQVYTTSRKVHHLDEAGFLQTGEFYHVLAGDDAADE